MTRRKRVPGPATIAPAMDLESVDRVLRTTRSVRRRIDFERPVEAEVLEECIEIATQAPTGADMESWRFFVLTEPDRKLAVARLYRRALETYVAARGFEPKPAQRALAERLHEMPALVLVCCEGRPLADSLAMQVAFFGSILPAAWSLMLALRSRGLGATWTTLHLVHERETAEVLGIPDGVTQTVLLPVGYTLGAVLKPAVRRAPADVTFWNEWGSRRNGPACDDRSGSSS
jgi:nitroreductase